MINQARPNDSELTRISKSPADTLGADGALDLIQLPAMLLQSRDVAGEGHIAEGCGAGGGRSVARHC